MARTPDTEVAAQAGAAPLSAPSQSPAKKPKPESAAPLAPGKSPSSSKSRVKAPSKTAAAPEKEKDVKTRKPKLVRDSFTIPKDEYAVIETLKERTARLSQPAKKSELLRAGLKLLAQLDDTALQKAMQAVPAIKTGRPKADKK